MTDVTPPTDECPEPPDDAIAMEEPPVAVPARVVASTIQTLNQLDEYFRHHASAATRAEVRVFAARQGWDPIQGAEVLLEGIGLNALSLGWAQDTNRSDQPAPTADTKPPSTMDTHRNGGVTATDEHRHVRSAGAPPQRHSQ
jgi:hypothetical protein